MAAKGSAGGSAGAWVSVGVGAGVVVGAVMMLGRTLRPTLEARAYVKDIGTATEGAQRNFSALAQLGRTRELAAALASRVERSAR